MDNFLLSLSFIILTLSTLFLSSFIADAKSSASFTIDLIHRDSKFSPFYNKSATSEELLRASVHRSKSRVSHFSQSSSFADDQQQIQTPVIPNGGSYLMKISIGTPPVERYATLDTGSDLVWVQCTPCDQCSPANAPLFNPMGSSTYTACRGSSSTCSFVQIYGVGSRVTGIRGILGTDTFTFDSTTGQPVSFPNKTFGCVQRTIGRFPSSGLVGLGGGSRSLITQLRDEIQQTFSYCLVPLTANTNSKLRFGKDAELSGNGVVSTPLISRGGSESTFYYLNLEGASVGGRRVSNSETNPSQGNIIIDSGSTLTLLAPEFYNDFEAAVKEAAVGLNQVQDPRNLFSLCFDGVPDVQFVFHFTGADVSLQTGNVFAGGAGNVVCMAIVPTPGSARIFGNVAQINSRVEYDLGKKLVSFAPADCSQF